jgi:hypothetical protein
VDSAVKLHDIAMGEGAVNPDMSTSGNSTTPAPAPAAAEEEEEEEEEAETASAPPEGSFVGPGLTQGSPDHRPIRISAVSTTSDIDSDDGLTVQPSQLSGIIMQQLASPRTLQQQQLSLLRHQAAQRIQHQQQQQQREHVGDSQAEPRAATSSAEAAAGTATETAAGAAAEAAGDAAGAAGAGSSVGSVLSAVERWQAYRLTLEEHLIAATVSASAAGLPGYLCCHRYATVPI